DQPGIASYPDGILPQLISCSKHEESLRDRLKPLREAPIRPGPPRRYTGSVPPSALPSLALMHPTLVARPFHRSAWVYEAESGGGAGRCRVPPRPAPSPRRIERRARISRTPLSCRLSRRGLCDLSHWTCFQARPYDTR